LIVLSPKQKLRPGELPDDKKVKFPVHTHKNQKNCSVHVRLYVLECRMRKKDFLIVCLTNFSELITHKNFDCHLDVDHTHKNTQNSLSDEKYSENAINTKLINH
jgi:hypothetical protein